METNLSFEAWDVRVPPDPEHVGAPIWRMRMYRMSCYLAVMVRGDAEALASDPLLVRIAPQLFEAVVSISANIAEGYPCSSGRDRARFYEYAVKSAREAQRWYRAAKPLDEDIVRERIDILTQIIKMLTVAIPRERRKNFRLK